MHKLVYAFALATAGFVAAAAPAAAQQAPAPQPEHYSVQTTKVGVLLDDPRTKAILERLIPTVYANEMFQTMGRNETLKSIQQYEPVALSDAVLATIQAEFDALPAHD